jgi:hypothetical protein
LGDLVVMKDRQTCHHQNFFIVRQKLIVIRSKPQPKRINRLVLILIMTYFVQETTIFAN